MNASLLIIAELGFEPMTRDDARLFFRLVTYRYGRGSILITVDRSVRDRTDLLAGDETLTAAILDRLLHNAHVLNIKGMPLDSCHKTPSRIVYLVGFQNRGDDDGSPGTASGHH